MTAASRRWALSFADLCLLLLGFFVLLHARAADPGGVAEGMRATFAVEARPMERRQERAGQLFEPGEAVLKAEARERFARLGGGATKVRIVSEGADMKTGRLDGWELAAARAAAVARAISAGGVGQDRIAIDIAETPLSAQREQRLTLVVSR